MAKNENPATPEIIRKLSKSECSLQTDLVPKSTQLGT